jgi:hypothetical protein
MANGNGVQKITPCVQLTVGLAPSLFSCDPANDNVCVADACGC